MYAIGQLKISNVKYTGNLSNWKSMQLSRYYQIKKRLKSLQIDASRLEGALEHTASRLKAHFNCSTLEEGKILLKKLGEDKKSIEASIEKKMTVFEKKWGSILNDKESETDKTQSESPPF